MKVEEKSVWGDVSQHEQLCFTDARGIHWSISERDATNVPGSMGARCLICMADAAVRRLWEYPRNWRQLAKDDLQRLVDRPRGGRTFNAPPVTS